MYLLRGMVVSFAVFFLVYVMLSAILVLVWQTWGRKHSIPSAAFLLGIRVSPLIAALGLVALFTLPSFLYLEPRFSSEAISAGALAVAAAGAALLLAGIFNSTRALVKTSRFIAGCMEHSLRLETASSICIYQVPSQDPLLVVAGVWRPKLLISSGTLALLDSDEIEAAIQHEIAHVNRSDNLKKLVLHCCAFPWLGSLEYEWLKATEMAADDAAADNKRTAISLASALIKMARPCVRMRTPELGMTLVPENGAAVSARVERLLSEISPASKKQDRVMWWALFASVGFVVCANYGWALLQMHEMTEFLIR